MDGSVPFPLTGSVDHPTHEVGDDDDAGHFQRISQLAGEGNDGLNGQYDKQKSHEKSGGGSKARRKPRRRLHGCACVFSEAC
jgi:hypothetical protein